MRKYSKVYAVIWQDKIIRSLEDKTRTIFLYLLTSPHTNMIGWYYLNINYAAADLGYPIDRVSEGLFELQEKGLITYSEDTNMVVIHNFLKYNPVKGKKQAKGAINTINNLADRSLLKVFVDCVAKHKKNNEVLYKLILEEYKDTISEEEIYPIDRVSKGYRKGINTDTDTDTNTDTDTDNNKGQQQKNYKNNFGKMYNYYLGGALSTSQLQMLKSYEEDGLNKKVIAKAFERAAEADKKSFAYVKKILNNWVKENISSVEEAEQAIKEFKNKNSNDKKTTEKKDMEDLYQEGYR